MRRISLILVLLASLSEAQRLPIRSWTTADGLAHNHINQILRDSRSLLWFATDDGLSFFDGLKFTSYNTSHGLPHPHINGILEDGPDAFWLATDGGICHFRIRRGNPADALFVTYPLPGSAESSHVNSLASSSDGQLWVATSDGLYRFHPGNHQFTAIPLPYPKMPEASHISTVLALPDGDVWAGGIGGLFHLPVKGDPSRHTFSLDHPSLFVVSMFPVGGRLWVCTRYHGLLEIEPGPKPKLLQALTEAQGLPTLDVRSMFRDASGQFWVATNGGVCLLETHRVSSCLGPENGLSAKQIYTVAEDSELNIWLGTYEAGVMRLARSRFFSYGTKERFEPNDLILLGVAADSRPLLITPNPARIRTISEAGISSQPVSLPNITLSTEAQGNVFQDASGAWWLPTATGLYRSPPARLPTGPRTLVGLKDVPILHVLPDRNGDVWVFSMKGLFCWRHLTNSFIPISTPAAVSAMAQAPDGAIWLGFDGNAGLGRIEHDRLQTWLPGNGAPSGKVSQLLFTAERTLWATSTDSGLTRITYDRGKQPLFEHFGRRQGLSSDELHCVVADRYQRLYLCTAQGMDRFDPANRSVERLATGDGHFRNGIATAAGTLWFVSASRLVRFDPSPPAPKAHTLPPVYFTQLQILGQPVALPETGDNKPPRLTLPFGRNHLHIEFRAPDFTMGSVIQYQRRMERIDRDWSPPSSQMALNYIDLPPGDYSLALRAVAPGGISSEPSSLQFTVVQPVWMRGWFWALVLALLAALIFFVIRTRIERQLALERMRSGIARDLHDDLGGTLSSIAIQSEVLQSRWPQADAESLRKLNRIQSSARALLQSWRDLVWATDPQLDHLGDVLVRVRLHASEVLEPAGIEWRLDCEPAAESIRLDPVRRRHLLMVFKECLTNAARHSGARHLRIVVSVTRGLLVDIEDDGRGFEAVHDRAGGTVNMRARMEQLKGGIEFGKSELGGARVRFYCLLRG